MESEWVGGNEQQQPGLLIPKSDDRRPLISHIHVGSQAALCVVDVVVIFFFCQDKHTPCCVLLGPVVR